MDANVRNFFIMSFLIANTDDDGVFRMPMKEVENKTGFNYRTIQKVIYSQIVIQSEYNRNTIVIQSQNKVLTISIPKELQGLKKLYYNQNTNDIQLYYNRKSQKDDKNNINNKTSNNSISSNINNNISSINISLKEREYKEKEKLSFLQGLIDAGVSEQVAKDWMAIRKVKKSSDTRTALSRITKQLEIVKHRIGDSPDDCIGMAIDKGWYGFQAEWYINEKQRNNGKQFRTDNSKNGDISREKKYIEGSLSDFE